MVFLGKQSLSTEQRYHKIPTTKEPISPWDPLAVILFPVLKPGMICVLVAEKGT